MALRTAGKKSVILLLALIVAFMGSNAATYYLASGRGRVASGSDDARTIIRYEPGQRKLDPETEMIWEAMDALKGAYFYPLETEKLVEGAVRGMVAIVEDPLMQFFDPDALEDFLSDTKGTYAGIGVRIIEAQQGIVVYEVFTGSPAEFSGLTPGDRILKAGNRELTDGGLNLAVELLRGPAGTAVDVLIKRPGSDEPIEMTIERAEIKISTVFSEMLDDNRGYILISSFDSNTAAEFTGQLRELEQHGLGRGLVLDLRNNTGGLVDQAVEVAKELVPEGEIVRLVGRDERVRKIYNSSSDPRPYPIVVLINEETASSAELLAGALQDREAAVLVGSTTFGKASVQHLEYVSEDKAILLTVAKYFTPSGHDIEQHGIVPDVQVEMPEILRYFRYFHPGRLEKGDYGPDVEVLQLMLTQIGYPVDDTGYFDDQTFRAISDFQSASGLERSGVFDDLTWIELREGLELAALEQDEQLKEALKTLEEVTLLKPVGGGSR